MNHLSSAWNRKSNSQRLCHRRRIKTERITGSSCNRKRKKAFSDCPKRFMSFRLYSTGPPFPVHTTIRAWKSIQRQWKWGGLWEPWGNWWARCWYAIQVWANRLHFWGLRTKLDKRENWARELNIWLTTVMSLFVGILLVGPIWIFFLCGLRSIYHSLRVFYTCTS